LLWTPEARRAHTQFVLRPVDPEVAKEVEARFPKVEDLWTIHGLGGWSAVLKEIYGPDGIRPRVFAA
jgi:ABC-type sulfate transport system substrate-binding protein